MATSRSRRGKGCGSKKGYDLEIHRRKKERGKKADWRSISNPDLIGPPRPRKVHEHTPRREKNLRDQIAWGGKKKKKKTTGPRSKGRPPHHRVGPLRCLQKKEKDWAAKSKGMARGMIQLGLEDRRIFERRAKKGSVADIVEKKRSSTLTCRFVYL